MTPAKIHKYDEHVANRVVEHVADGGTIRKFSNHKGNPTTSDIYRWARQHPEFARALKEAFEWSALMQEEEAIDESRGSMVAPNKEHIAAVRTLNEQLRWSAERRDPGKYGNTAKMNIKVPVQIITSLNLGQTGAVADVVDQNIYQVDAEVIDVVPLEEIKPLQIPPPPKKKLQLTPRQPFKTALFAYKGAKDEEPNGRSGRNPGSIRQPTRDEGEIEDETGEETQTVGEIPEVEATEQPVLQRGEVKHARPQPLSRRTSERVQATDEVEGESPRGSE